MFGYRKEICEFKLKPCIVQSVHTDFEEVLNNEERVWLFVSSVQAFQFDDFVNV
jgi:hypothetical protein